MTEKIMDKHIISESDFITCEICGKGITKIDKRHLNTHEEKIDLDRYLQLFPNNPTITKERYNKELEAIEKRKESKDDTQTKIVKCIYFDECENQVEVNKNAPNNSVVCQTCRDNGKEVPMSKRLKNTTEKIKRDRGVNNISELESVKQTKKETHEKNKKNDPDIDKKSQEKREKTLENKFGPNYKEIMRELQIQGMIEKYGTSNTNEIPGVTEERVKKFKETKKKKLKEKIENVLKELNLRILDEFDNTHDKCAIECLTCGRKFQKRIYEIPRYDELCPNCKTTIKSKGQNEVYEFIKSLGFYADNNTRSIISPLELDVYIPNKNIAVEYDGLYSHSEEFKEKKYHSMKTDMCNKLGIRLIHIFEDEWLQKKDIVKERLKYILGCSDATIISARNCNVKELDQQTKNEFLYNFHIQGPDISGIRLGLYYNDKLVSVMTFQRKRKNSLNFKLNRFCSDYNYIVNGAAGKLLSYFKNNYDWDDILTYADLRWSQNGDLYHNLGFDLDGKTEEDYWYTNGLERLSRLVFRKTENDPKDIPEHELRKKEGYYRIWGCGSLRFKMINNNKENVNYNNDPELENELDKSDNNYEIKQVQRNVNETKTVKCIYCDNTITRTKYESNKYICKECEEKGFKNPDKRKSKETQIKRVKTNREKYNVDNVQQIDEVKSISMETSRNNNGGVGFENPENLKNLQNCLLETTGYDNIMKTPEMRDYFSKPRPEKVKIKISESNKGKPSKSKGKRYEEIMGEEKAEKLKEEKKSKGINQYKQDVFNRLEEMNIELLDEEYKGIKYKHNFRCKLCGKEFSCKYSILKRRYKVCGNKDCDNVNPTQIK